MEYQYLNVNLFLSAVVADAGGSNVFCPACSPPYADQPATTLLVCQVAVVHIVQDVQEAHDGKPYLDPHPGLGQLQHHEEE